MPTKVSYYCIKICIEEMYIIERFILKMHIFVTQLSFIIDCLESNACFSSFAQRMGSNHKSIGN